MNICAVVRDSILALVAMSTLPGGGWINVLENVNSHLTIVHLVKLVLARKSNCAAASCSNYMKLKPKWVRTHYDFKKVIRKKEG